jgi:hypothetical protein
VHDADSDRWIRQILDDSVCSNDAQDRSCRVRAGRPARRDAADVRKARRLVAELLGARSDWEVLKGLAVAGRRRLRHALSA